MAGFVSGVVLVEALTQFLVGDAQVWQIYPLCVVVSLGLCCSLLGMLPLEFSGFGLCSYQRGAIGPRGLLVLAKSLIRFDHDACFACLIIFLSFFSVALSLFLF